MIGQKRLKEIINRYKENNNLPKFIIFVGNEGIGKKEFLKYISRLYNYKYIIFENSQDDIKMVKRLANEQKEPIFYCIDDYNSMSINARNSLLKITEETPGNAHIILTATNKSDILQTLISRALVLELDEYSEEELNEFITLHNLNKEFLKITTIPGKILELKNLDLNEFNSFINNIWDNLSVASIGNSLKIPNKLKIKKDATEGYDLEVFLGALLNKIIEHSRANSNIKTLERNKKLINLVYTTKRHLGMKYSKQSIVDMFILEFREVLNGTI